MKLLFPLRVEPGRAIVDRDGNIVATVHARRQLNRSGYVYESTDPHAIGPTDADENAHELVRLLNLAAGGRQA